MTQGPVSQALAEELLQEVRRQGIVVWLDKDASYTGFVDRLAAEVGSEGPGTSAPFPVVRFRGSFLEVLFALESHGSGYDKHALLVHMPGFNQDSIRATPLLELYRAGKQYWKSLDTLIRQAATGRIVPEEVEAFLRQKPALEQADEWLAASITKRTGGLDALLAASGPMLVVEALMRKDSTLAAQIATDAEAGVLQSYLHTLTGMDDEWFSFAIGDPSRTSVEKTMNALGTWLLCVEYVHDLRRDPHIAPLKRLKTLSPPLVKSCCALVYEMRAKHAAAYAELADDAESFLDIELRQMKPEDLGRIDTFREEENRVLGGAVEALQARQWDKARAWCEEREGEKSFWLSRDQARRRAWNVVGEAAAFGRVLAQHPRPFEKLLSHDDALARYAAAGALVDRAHRRFEQEWLRRLDTQMPYYGALLEVLGMLRKLHREWADVLCKDFTRLCQDTGFLPPSELQQRTLYEEVVQPLALGGEKIAVFLVDAFRYEMATELSDELCAEAGGAVVNLKARFAELPTITSVGMNALAPVARDGRLVTTGVLGGFRAGEYTVRLPGDRARAMGVRTSGKPGLLLGLGEICEATPESLRKRMRDHEVVVVCSTEIDDAGEANVGLLTFEAQLRQIKAAWHHLLGAGVKQAVFTADHGFLLQDATARVQSFGKKTDPQRRYVLDEYERGEAGLVPVAFSKLGYDGMTGYLLVPDDTAVFATKSTGASFVHGGNSPQERIIPVLVVMRKTAGASSLTEYAVEAEPMDRAFGCHRVRVRLVIPAASQTSLGFVGARSIDLDVRVPGRKDIRALVKEVAGPGTLRTGRLSVPVGDTWTELFFALEGPTDERVELEVYHADKIENVRACKLDALFAVAGTGAGRAGASAGTATWADGIEDEAIRGVFMHIEKHGSVTESEIITMLGNARAARRFALNFDQYLTKLPFAIRSESNASGKRYVREEDK